MTDELLTDVLLSSDPNGDNEWSAKTLRACDVLKLDEGENSWQVKVNKKLVGRARSVGSIGGARVAVWLR